MQIYIQKTSGSRPQLFWAPWGFCLWYLGTSTIHHKRFESLSFQKKMNVTVLNSIRVNCTLKSSIDCFLSTFICILGSLLAHSSNHWIQKKDTWSIERDKVFTNVLFFFFFNMFTMIRPLTRFFPICLTLKIPPLLPTKKTVGEKPKTKKSPGHLQTKTKPESRGWEKTLKKGRNEVGERI